MSLMTLPQHVLDAWEIQKRTKKRGHAAQPGTGPAGETCPPCSTAQHDVGATRMLVTAGEFGAISGDGTGGAANAITAPITWLWTERTHD